MRCKGCKVKFALVVGLYLHFHVHPWFDSTLLQNQTRLLQNDHWILKSKRWMIDASKRYRVENKFRSKNNLQMQMIPINRHLPWFETSSMSTSSVDSSISGAIMAAALDAVDTDD